VENLDKLRALGIPVTDGGSQQYTICPWCSSERSREHRNRRCLSVNIPKGIYNCHHCEKSGSVRADKGSVASFTLRPELDQTITEWLEQSRGISQRTLWANGAITEPRFFPESQTTQVALVFNYYKEGDLVYQKARTKDKQFVSKRVKEGAPIPLYREDHISYEEPVLIVEGEMDALSFCEAGFYNVISPPHGAGTNKLLFEEFAKKTTTHGVIICVDNDEKGKQLKHMLLEVFHGQSIREINIVPSCKDINDVLVKYGVEGVEYAFNQARELPPDGVLTASDLLEKVLKLRHDESMQGVSTGFKNLDDIFSLVRGELTIISGFPGNGKSTFLNNMLVHSINLHNWRIASFSPEHHPVESHLASLLEISTNIPYRSPFKRGIEAPVVLTDEIIKREVERLADRFIFIRPDPRRVPETFENILGLLEYGARNGGLDAVVIDPWNRIDLEATRDNTMTQKINKCLNEVQQFAEEYKTHVFIVAHPSKITGSHKGKPKDGSAPKILPPTEADISDSSNWWRRADNVIIVHREDPTTRQSQVHIRKCRNKTTGREGVAHFVYNEKTGVFTPDTSQPTTSIF
jgi:twinkle protein